MLSDLRRFDFLSPRAQPELPVSGSVALTAGVFGRMVACSDAGVPADYTLTLPPVAGQAGRRVGILVEPAATKKVTLDGNGAETVGGAASRDLLGGDFVVLEARAGGWVRVGGVIVPCSCTLVSATATNASHDAPTKFLLTDVQENTGGIADGPNSRAVVRRAGTYLLTAQINFNSLAAGTRVIGYHAVNGALTRLFSASVLGGANNAYTSGPSKVTVAAGQFVELWGSWDVSGGSGTKSSNVGTPQTKPWLTLTEEIKW